MTLSILLLTWNSECDLKACLDSLFVATRNIEREIIVIDNGSSDGTLPYLERLSDSIRLVRNPHNLGVAAARNQGLKLAQGEFIWILDIDTVVNQQAIEGMITYLIENPNCGLCGCTLTSLHGEIQESCRKLPMPKYKLLNLLSAIGKRYRWSPHLVNWIDKKNSEQFYTAQQLGNAPFEVEYLIGACQLFSASLLSKIGLLDDRIFYGPEDADFCLRTTQAGMRVVYLPHLAIIHHYNRITNKRLFSRMSYLHLKGILYFYIKHKRI